MKPEFSDKFSKNIQISNFTKICPVGAEMFHADGKTDGRTDMTKLIFAFRNFANAPKKNSVLWFFGDGVSNPKYIGCTKRSMPCFVRNFFRLISIDITKAPIPELNGCRDNDGRNKWSSCGSMYCIC
jgi:hypothetical protein